MSETLPVETWRGCANAWECDEYGHLNVRFWLAKWSQALAFQAAAAGLPGGFGPRAASTLLPAEQHIRFLSEARAGAPLAMAGGVTRVGEDDATFYDETRHGDGRLAATFVTRAVHADGRTGAPFPWPQRMRARLEALSCAVPREAAPRSIDLSAPPSKANMAHADALDLPCVGRSMVSAEEVDALGRMRAEFCLGRLSDGVAVLTPALPPSNAEKRGAAKSIGSAMLECRLIYRRWPGVGDLIVLRSGHSAFEGKIRRIVHWALDPVTGEAWWTAEAVAVWFDLKARKSVALAPEQLAGVDVRTFPGLAV